MAYLDNAQQAPPPADATATPQDTRPTDTSFRISDLPRMTNVAEILADDGDNGLTAIGGNVHDDYEIDKKSRTDKEEEWRKAAEAFTLKRETKNYPFDKAANVKFPVLLTAAIQFAARAISAVIHDGKVCKGKPLGEDPQGLKQQQADRVGGYMNYQLLVKDKGWAKEEDQLLHQLPVFGTVMKKCYWDPVRGNCSELVSIQDFIINAAYPSLDRAPRWTHRYDLYPYQIEERKRDGRFLKIELINAPSTEDKEDGKKDNTEDYSDDKDACHEFLEQYRRIDLDEDDYAEPYLVTLHVPTKKVVRIVTAYDKEDVVINQASQEVARIGMRPCFVKYGFIPDPSGSFYDIGYGQLLNDISETINSTANQIMDAANLQTAGGGFIGKELRLKSGVIQQKLGQWQQLQFGGDDIRKAMVQFQHPGPSPVLFQLLEFLINEAEKISNTQNVLSGDAPPNQPATTTLAMVEQGLKVFTGIVGRVLESLSQELEVMYDLNGRYMNEIQGEYFEFGDDAGYVSRVDFDRNSANVVPVADSTVTTDAQAMARAQMMMTFLNDPLTNQIELRKRVLASSHIPSAGLVVDQMPQQPDPAQAQIDMKQKMNDQELAHNDAKHQQAMQHQTDAVNQKMANNQGMSDQQIQLKQHQATMAMVAKLTGNSAKGINPEADQQQSAADQQQSDTIAHAIEAIGQMMAAGQQQMAQLIASTNQQLIAAITAPKQVVTPEGRTYTSTTATLN